MSIPAWVLEAIEAWMAEGMSGDLRLIARGGVIKHIRREDLILPPPEAVPGVVPLDRHCPACGKQMEARDYGNLYLCQCGTKRTRAQMLVGKK